MQWRISWGSTEPPRFGLHLALRSTDDRLNTDNGTLSLATELTTFLGKGCSMLEVLKGAVAQK